MQRKFSEHTLNISRLVHWLHLHVSLKQLSSRGEELNPCSVVNTFLLFLLQRRSISLWRSLPTMLLECFCLSAVFWPLMASALPPSSICAYWELVILESQVLNLLCPLPHVVVLCGKGFYWRGAGWWIRSIPRIPCSGNGSSVSDFDSDSRWWVSRAKAALRGRRCESAAVMASSSRPSLPVAHGGLPVQPGDAGPWTLLKRRCHF